MRSKGSANPKEAGQQAVAIHTAECGPEGPRLRSKYLRHATKSTGGSGKNNSGSAGRRFRRRQRAEGYKTRSYSPAGRISNKK